MIRNGDEASDPYAELHQADYEGLAPPLERYEPANPESVVLVGAGDIAYCDRNQDDQTAALLETVEGVVFTLGDNVYPDGTTEEFLDCYGPSWGRHARRTRPAIGDHEFETPMYGTGYHEYFGNRAGNFGRWWYAYDAGPNWHVVVLNSNGPDVACHAESDQARWLEDELTTNRDKNVLAYWYVPRFASGPYGDPDGADYYLPFWTLLYEHGADLVLGGHEHAYERFAPMDPSGDRDEQGIRQFIVGTGGAAFTEFHDALHPASEVARNDVHGVLKLTLKPRSYAWELLSLDGSAVDSG